jgi:hypothetical protein
MGRYATEAAALSRVEVLKKAGRWPGIIRRADGTCDLTWDPEATT